MNNYWTRHLKKDEDKAEKDIYENYKENINIKLTECISEITQNLMTSGLNYTPEIANKMAINLVMEQLLGMQYQHSPKSQKAMVVNLFVELPEAQDVREEIMSLLVKKEEKKSKP